MEQAEIPQLGYSDLTDDECFIISVFRHWQELGPTRLAAEKRLSVRLRDDTLYEGLKYLFELFRSLPCSRSSQTLSRSALLSETEEDLLTRLATEGRAYDANIQRFRQVLSLANVTIRPANKIPRSGHDQLLETIDRRSSDVLHSLYLGVL